MRRIVGYIDGRPIWSENTPANGAAGPVRHSGSFVQGEPGWKERRKAVNPPLTANQKRSDDRPIVNGRPRLSGDVDLVGRGKGYASEEERTAARRQTWREASRRRRAA